MAEGSKVVHGPDLNGSKPETDEKQYRLITLEKNNLQCLLVSDTRTYGDIDESDSESEGESSASEEDEDIGDQHGNKCRNDSIGTEGDEDEEEDADDLDGGRKRRAAVCVTVGIGSFSDPKECQGLAHFLEHMLFMGSEKYPAENAFDSFLSQNGGDSNAYTEGEHTSFYFKCKVKALKHALDIFAQFFVAPLMLENSVDRELSAIENEFESSRTSDSVRLQEIVCRTSRPGHPLSLFGWGNFKSLRDEPLANGLEPLKMLRKLYNEFYVAGNMKVCVCASLPLDEMERIVSETCHTIRSKPDDAPCDWKFAPATLEKYGLPFQGAQTDMDKKARDEELVKRGVALKCVFYSIPINDAHRLYITWQLPSLMKHYKSNPSDYFSHLIGHESAGSILYVAKERGWANSLSAGPDDGGYESNTGCTLFTITINLSVEGACEWKKVVQLVYDYIGLLRGVGPQKRVYDELVSIQEIDYRFREEQDPEDFVQDLAVDLLPQRFYENKDLLKGPYVLQEWNPQLLTEVLDNLTVDNMRIDISSGLFGNDGDLSSEPSEGDEDVKMVSEEDIKIEGKFPNNPAEDSSRSPCVEPYYGTRFWGEQIDEATLLLWDSAMKRACAEANETCITTSKLHLPRENPYVAGNFELEPFPSKHALHPLVGAYVKVQFKTKRRVEWVHGFVLRYDSTKHTIFISFEDSFGEEPLQYELSQEEIEWAPKPSREEIIIKPCGKQKKEVKCVILGGGQGLGGGSPQQLGALASRLLDERAEAKDEAAAINVSGNRTPVFGDCYVPHLDKGCSTPFFKIYSLHNRVFLRPKIVIFIDLICGANNTANSSPRNAVGTSMFLNLVSDSFEDEAYLAAQADLGYEVSRSSDGIRLAFYGFHDKLFKFIQSALEHFFQKALELTDRNRQRFKMKKESLTRNYRNMNMKTNKYVSALRVQVLDKLSWDAQSLYEALMDENNFASLEKLRRFVFDELLSECMLDAIFSGNTSQKTTKQVHELFVSSFRAHCVKMKELERKKYHKREVVALSPGQAILVERVGKNPTDRNGSTELYFQIGTWDRKDKIILDLIDQIMEEPVYDILRTKRQLGYSVSCGTRFTYGQLGFVVKVTSSTFTTEQVEKHIFDFLVDFATTLEELSREKFEEAVGSMIEILLEDDNTLYSETKRLWHKFFDNEQDWSEAQAEAFALFDITKAQVVECYKKWLLPTSPEAKMICVRVNGKAMKPTGAFPDRLVEPIPFTRR